jgi:coproporphyrinogen III oxidase
MKAILEFNLPEDNIEYKLVNNAGKIHSVLWDMDQWLRAQYKYMPDEEYNEVAYNTYLKCREQLRELLNEKNIDL